jgi:hypothetical protein
VADVSEIFLGKLLKNSVHPAFALLRSQISHDLRSFNHYRGFFFAAAVNLPDMEALFTHAM